MSDVQIEFAQGIYYNEPHQNAPSFIKGKLSIQKEKLIEWLSGKTANEQGYINLQIKVAKSGRPYIAVDTWEPTQSNTQAAQQPQQQPQQQATTTTTDDIPF